MSVKCKSCGAQSNAADQLSFVCEFCGTKNVDEKYLQNLAAQKASAEANSKSFHLGLVAVQGNDIVSAEKQFETAVTEDPNNPDAWVYLAYCKAALVKPSNYERNVGIARQALHKAKSLANSSEVLDNGVVLVGGKFLQASVEASAYYIDTAMKKFFAFGGDSSARKMAASEAATGLGILRDAIQMADSNLDLVAVSAVFAYAKSFELIKAIGNEKIVADFKHEFGKTLLHVHNQRKELIERELEKYDSSLGKEFKSLLAKSGVTAVSSGTISAEKDDKPVIKKALMVVGALMVVIIAAIFFRGSDKNQEPAQASTQNQTVAPVVVAAPAAPSTSVATTEPDAVSAKPAGDSVEFKDVIAPAEARPLLAAMLASASSSFRLTELKNQLENLPKPAPGDRKSARKLNEQALALFRSDRFDEAVELFHQGLDADPSDIEVKNNYVYAMIKAGKLDEAETVAGELLMNNPGRSSAWANLAEIYAIKGKEEEAARAFVVAFQFSSNKDKTLAILREKMGDDTSSLKLVAAKAIALIEKI